MPLLAALLAAALFVGIVAYLARRARTLFELEFRDGELTRAFGHLPPSLLDDIVDIEPGPQSGRLVIRCVIDQGHARIVPQGIVTEESLQRLRNVVGRWPLARLRTTPSRKVTAHHR